MRERWREKWNDARWIVAGWLLLLGLWPFFDTHEGPEGTMDLLGHAFGAVWMIWLLIPVVRRALDD